jgi:undecaprenyl diphosphate synthase
MHRITGMGIRMIHWLYEWQLKRHITILPGHICFMLTAAEINADPGKIFLATSRCIELGIGKVTFHIDTRGSDDPGLVIGNIRRLSSISRLHLYYEDREEIAGSGIDVTVAIGKSGREEITECIKALAREQINPEDVDEELIDRHLTFRCEPDLVIKTGGSHLTDFLIWQSVYSELFFSDVNWKYFRKIDFLRALRDYQFRKRRFGR